MISDVVDNYHSAASALGAFERAGHVFEDIVSRCPRNKLIKYRLIDLLIKQEKNVQAMAYIEDAIAFFGVNDGILSSALTIRELLGPKEIDKTKDAKSTVSLCMIVKNEEKHLAKCLHSAKPVVDEMIIVDTGSTDRTKNIAEAFGARVYTFQWTDDFSEARNFSISKAKGRWIFVMDADEVISSLDYESFQEIVRRTDRKPVGHVFTTRNYTTDLNQIHWTANDEKYVEEASGFGWTPSSKVRLFPNQNDIRFEAPVHEFIEDSLKRAGIGERRCNIPIHHYGKLDHENTLSKGKVYYKIGMKKLHEIEDDPIAIRELAIQAQTIEKYEEAIELWHRLIAIEPNMPVAFVSLGAAYCKLGKYEDALWTAENALKLVPDMKEGLYNFALSKLHLRRAGQAIPVLEKLLKQTPDFSPAQFILSAAYCCEGRRTAGVEGFKQLMGTAMGPTLPCRLLDLAKGLVNAQSPGYALSILEAAIESKVSDEEIQAFYAGCVKVRNSSGVVR